MAGPRRKPSVVLEYIAAVIDHRRRSKDPAAWFSVGYSLWIAADILWKRLRPALEALRPDTQPTDDHQLALRLRGPFAMLTGMAIEAMLKGAILQRLPASARHIVKTHKLVPLSDLAKIKWNDAQRDVLQRLTTFIEWAGRYPVGLSKEQSQESRSLKSTDYVTIVDIATHLYDIHHGRA